MTQNFIPLFIRCYKVLQRIVMIDMLQDGMLCCKVSRGVARCCEVLQVARCCEVLQGAKSIIGVARCYEVLQGVSRFCKVLRGVLDVVRCCKML